MKEIFTLLFGITLLFADLTEPFSYSKSKH